eukprot:COSAG02_NODE_3251_length_7094_cov_3.932094_3_plen_187_part_00
MIACEWNCLSVLRLTLPCLPCYGIFAASDPAYIKTLIESFGGWDTDKDGVLGFDEFLQLWQHLGGDERARAAGLLPGDPMAEEFKKYAKVDTDGRSYLDKEAVKRMMVEHGFAPTDQYLEGVWKEVSACPCGDARQRSFVMSPQDVVRCSDRECHLAAQMAEADEDGDGKITLNEFPRLWAFLGLG